MNKINRGEVIIHDWYEILNSVGEWFRIDSGGLMRVNFNQNNSFLAIKRITSKRYWP